MSARCFFVCATLLLLFTNGANAARYQRTKDGKTLVWNNLRGVAEQATWSGARDSDGYATGEGTLTWYRLGEFVNSYTGKMVRGKFEGPVIKEQGQTRLQAPFANGNKVGDWSEPGASEARTPTPPPKQEPPKPVETPQAKEPELLPTPIPSRSPTQFPTPLPTATSSPTPTSTATPASTPSPTATPTPTLTPMPTPRPSPTETPPSPTPSPIQQPPSKGSRLEEVVEGPTQDVLELPNPASSFRNALEEVPGVEPSAPSPSATAIRVGVDQKNRMIAEFKEQTKSVLAQVRDATGNFHEIDRIDTVAVLPPSVTASVASLANHARDFRSKLGYEIAFHECRVETETVDALTVVDQVARSLAEEDAPSARSTLVKFLKRYPEPTADIEKPMWRYLTSTLSLCNRLKDEAAKHLERAQSLGAAGKIGEALREFQEIYRIYPNPVTAAKIRQLESETR